MRKLIVFVVLLGVLLVVLDRVAVSGVEREIARQVAAKYDLATPPEVSIEGIPFLTQAVAGRYEEIKLDIGEVSQRGVELTAVNATLYGVTAPLAQLVQDAANAKIMAERVVGAVVIPRDLIERRAPRGFKVRGDGDAITVSGEVSARGVRVPVQATMKWELVERGLRLTPQEVTVAGGIPVPAEATRNLTYTIPIPELPLDLRLTEVQSVPEGLRVSGEAADVPLNG